MGASKFSLINKFFGNVEMFRRIGSLELKVCLMLIYLDLVYEFFGFSASHPIAVPINRSTSVPGTKQNCSNTYGRAMSSDCLEVCCKLECSDKINQDALDIDSCSSPKSALLPAKLKCQTTNNRTKGGFLKAFRCFEG